MYMKLTAVTLDCADPLALAAFYHRATGLPLHEGSDGDFAGLLGAGETEGANGLYLGFQRIDDHRAPTWPDGAVPQQSHLCFDVDDLDEAETELLALGATLPAAAQPHPDLWRVLLDPAGHPFCVSVPKTRRAETP
ncbi:VOC family protein [Streptomyces sp. NBC_00094]|uniref:VOC family protein n=1 Tax=Streptomyces sp. NBC_00094 TaxID=2903620 RepID=UPI00224FB5F9|nr:VOC family protein [Streptomyces sp. NBC_00094]MCX5391180.1 VOC family protein [Streptomyces sp. NBC_00094]